MSVELLDKHSKSFETVNSLELLEKCGDVYLERHLGNLVFLCNLCDDKFQNADGFSNHITEIHVSVESFIAYDPSESADDVDMEMNEDIDPIEKCMQDQDAEFNIIDYEFLIKNKENNTPEEDDSTEICKENPISDRDVEIEDTLKKETNEVLEPFEISLYKEESSSPSHLPLIPEKKVIEDEEPPDPSDEEILRSKLICKFCGEQFEYVKKMRQHDCGLNKKKKHFCSVCGKEFKKKSGLDIHMLLHKGEKPHKCDICGTAYACKQNLIVHVRRHTGEKPFKCDYCDRRFASSTERISHMRTHTGDRPFVCELCGKGHSSSSQLTEHMHRHLDIRNYVCEICDKRFRNSYNLRMHRMTHEKGPRQHHCTQCSSTFKTHSSLLQHVKIHEKIKKYVCKICGRAFAQHPGLYSHMKSHAPAN